MEYMPYSTSMPLLILYTVRGKKLKEIARKVLLNNLGIWKILYATLFNHKFIKSNIPESLFWHWKKANFLGKMQYLLKL